ncbi:MAG TPA: hypothetical protein VJB08_07340 [Candidatus Nanoarchaeia archaeon]|nr:hypothetical protein [Candidatus Nanoarchaeia archaeon]
MNSPSYHKKGSFFFMQRKNKCKEILGKEQCTKLPVQTAAKNAKFRSSQQETGQYTAESASVKKSHEDSRS